MASLSPCSGASRQPARRLRPRPPAASRMLRYRTMELAMGTMDRGVRSAAVILLTGCRTVGPNYNRPAAPTSPAFKEAPPAGWKDAAPSDNIGKGNWWEIFGDPQLNDLETQAIAANQSLQAAEQRVLEARAAAGAP